MRINRKFGLSAQPYVDIVLLFFGRVRAGAHRRAPQGANSAGAQLAGNAPSKMGVPAPGATAEPSGSS